jgi:hypothetical protein
MFIFINNYIIRNIYIYIYYDFIQLFMLFSHVSYASSFIQICCDDEGMSFMTFVQRSLYPSGDNAPMDEGH